MKQLNRVLAMLVAVLMLCGMLGAVAEMDVALDLEQSIEDVELEYALDEPDAVLELNDDLNDALNGDLEALLSEEPEAAEPVEAEGFAANAAAPVRANDEEEPFVIDESGTLVKYNGSDATVTIPDNVVSIGSGAFKGNTSLNKVTIQEGVTSIQSEAFYGCENLDTVIVLAKNITIASNAFKGTKPAFHTVIGSTAAAWARKKGFKASDNYVVVTGNIHMKATIGQTLRIYLKNQKAISFVSNNASVATVNQSGHVTVKNGGTAQIRIVLEDQSVLTLTLKVPFPTPHLNMSAVSMWLGGTRTLKVLKLSGRTVSWSSSDTGIATVRGGLVTSVRPGKCTIKATLSDGTVLKCKVTVKDFARFSRSRLTVNAGHTKKLKIKGLVRRKVTWSSSDSSVASVKKGVITAYKAGKCTITADIQDGKTLKCKVTVKDKAKLNKTSVTLKPGGLVNLSVKNRGDRTVTWSSSDAGIASVQNGRVLAHRTGSCTITAKLSGGKKLTCKVTVTDNAKLNKTQLTLKEGETFQLTISGQGQNSVTWFSNYENVATVSRNGLVTAVKAGKCTITAKLSNGTELYCKVTVESK